MISGQNVTGKQTASEMTYTVSGGALNSTQSNPITGKRLQLKTLTEKT